MPTSTPSSFQEPSRSGMFSQWSEWRRRSSCVCNHSSNITTSCEPNARTVVFLHFFLIEFIYALLPHCTFCSAIAVHCHHRVARFSWTTRSIGDFGATFLQHAVGDTPLLWQHFEVLEEVFFVDSTYYYILWITAK